MHSAPFQPFTEAVALHATCMSGHANAVTWLLLMLRHQTKQESVPEAEKGEKMNAWDYTTSR